MSVERIQRRLAPNASAVLESAQFEVIVKERLQNLVPLNYAYRSCVVISESRVREGKVRLRAVVGTYRWCAAAARAC